MTSLNTTPSCWMGSTIALIASSSMPFSPVELLILDDWALAPLTSQQGRDLLDIVDDRHGRGSTPSSTDTS